LRKFKDVLLDLPHTLPRVGSWQTLPHPRQFPFLCRAALLSAIRCRMTQPTEIFAKQDSVQSSELGPLSRKGLGSKDFWQKWKK